MKRFKLSFTENPVFKSVTGLLNKTWNGTPVSGRAATEDQLKAAIDANKVTYVGEDGIEINPTQGVDNSYTISLDQDIHLNRTDGVDEEVTVGISNGMTFTSEGTEVLSVNSHYISLVDSQDENKTITISNDDSEITISAGENDSAVISNNAITMDNFDPNSGYQKSVTINTGDGIILNEVDRIELTSRVHDNRLVIDRDVIFLENGGEEILRVGDHGGDGYFLTGLTNTTWVEGTNPVTGRAATEDQIAAAIAALPADVNTITTVVGEGGISVTDNGTGGNHDYTVKPGSQMTVGSTEQGSTDNPVLIDGEDGVIDGLTNTSWDGDNIVSGRAVTEDQLKDAIDNLPADVNTITTVAAGTGVTVVDNGTGGNHAYTISATGTETTLTQGTNVTIVDNGTGGNHAYTVSATDTNTVTTVAAASGSTNVTVTDNGTGGNHAYVIAVDEGEEVEVVSDDTNIIVTVETV